MRANPSVATEGVNVTLVRALTSLHPMATRRDVTVPLDLLDRAVQEYIDGRSAGVVDGAL